MREPNEIEKYISDLKRRMKGDPILAKRVAEEVEDHLMESTEEEEKRGAGPTEARRLAVERMGPPKDLASQLPRFGWVTRGLLATAAVISLLVGAWLVYVLLLVLPGRNNNQIPFWSLVCAGFFGYGIVTLLFLGGLSRNRWLRAALTLVSLLSIPVGGYAIYSQIERASRGLDFEGYIVLMGLALAGHGALFVIHSLLTRGDVTRTAKV